MREVVRFQADDGSVWDTRDQAIHRDGVIAQCRALEAELALLPRPDGTEFSSGHGFIQQPKGSRRALNDALHAMGANRDSAGPIGHLLYRLMCMDRHDREYGQPYFASHPQEVDGGCLNPEHATS